MITYGRSTPTGLAAATAPATAPGTDYGSNAAQQDAMRRVVDTHAGEGTMRGIVDGTGPGWQREPTPTRWGTGGSRSVLRDGAPESELDRQLRWGNANAMAWQQQVKGAGIVAEDLPQPATAGILGTVEYYDLRARDFSRRHPGRPLPDYYLGYGQKYCFRFSEELFPKLSDAGKRWCITTRMNLQLAIERRLLADPAAFDALEATPGALRAFAFDTHPQAYLDGGLADLPSADLAQIALTPDWDDLATLAGAIQVGRTADGVAREWGGDLVDGGERVLDDLGEWWRDPDADATAQEAA